MPLFLPGQVMLEGERLKMGNDLVNQRTQLLSGIGRAESNHTHAGSCTGLDAIEGILENQAVGWVFVQIFCCQSVAHRVWLALGDPIGGDYRVEKAIQME